LFYPNDGGTARIGDEEDLRKRLPHFFVWHLAPHRAELEGRSSISRAGRKDWWGLSERRSWSASRAPRIVSKYFGAPGSFALDPQGLYAVVQGYAWFPRAEDPGPDVADADEDDVYDPASAAGTTIRPELLPAFAALFNSEPFHTVLRLFSSYVGGGQYDLSPRFVNKVPIPDLVSAARDERGGSMLAQLTSLGTHMAPQDPEWRAQVNSVVRSLYGEALFEDL
jgi:adenine-specific DNA-methyltransferase